MLITPRLPNRRLPLLTSAASRHNLAAVLGALSGAVRPSLPADQIVEHNLDPTRARCRSSLFPRLLSCSAAAHEALRPSGCDRRNQVPILIVDKFWGRQIDREQFEEPWRALLAASASRCSSWRSAASARGSR